MKKKLLSETQIIGPQDGEHVLMLHGMTGSPLELIPLAHILAEKGFKSFIPALSGHGTNLRDFRHTRAKSWVQDAHRAIEQATDGGQTRCSIVGHSFGATLALYVALGRPSLIKNIVLISPTLVIKPRSISILLNMASRLPEYLLDFLPLIPKRQTSSYCLVVPRTAYPVYSLGATARMFRIIRRVIPKLSRLKICTLLLRDPNDHLSHNKTLEIIKNACPDRILKVIELADAHHELLGGKHRQQAFELISDFLKRPPEG